MLSVKRGSDAHPALHPGAGAVAALCAIAAVALSAAGCASTQEARGREPGHVASDTPGALTESPLAVPPAIRTEHEHLHDQLEAAIASGGKTGAQARKVAAVLLAHFQEEEAYAMPPLGLLERLARNEPVEEAEARQAIQMAERLRHEYSKMLQEHQAMTVKLHALAAAAKDEAKPDQARFAEELILHARNEEQVLYPATLVVGDYLQLRRAGHVGR
jgi:hypothetical protein